MNNENTHKDFLSNNLKRDIEEKYKKLINDDNIKENNFYDILRKAIDDAYDKGWEIAMTKVKNAINDLI